MGLSSDSVAIPKLRLFYRKFGAGKRVLRLRVKIGAKIFVFGLVMYTVCKLCSFILIDIR